MRFVIRGIVQGVGFRPTVYRVACAMGLKGTVRNDGASVVIETDGDESFLERLRLELPALAYIESAVCEPYDLPGSVKDFRIVESGNGGHGVGIPTDTAICPKCLSELRGNGRRGGYAFTTCTECGARFTLMESNPYDRERTSMRDFPKCDECGSEYAEPGDRRFHHQTVCCPKCGPSYRLIDSEGEPIDGDPISVFASMIDDGKFGIAKSWGGMHICASIERVDELREWYGRKQKPFAVMVRDVNAVMKYAEPTEAELREMTSPHRPIVLVRKKDALPGSVSPGLDTVGMFLPYTGMQYLLFDRMKGDAAIMTSANVPGEPMILDDEDVMELGADMYLLHNQRIVNRADDSVMKLFGDNRYFLRKSRGHIPSYIEIPMKGDVAAVGPQENLTASVAKDGRIHTTQHIGNGESVGVVDYLETATDSLMEMLGCRPSAIATDIHPGYSNRKYAAALAERFDAEIVEVQHHWAHCASLMTDSGIEEMAALAIDGTGHGTDGCAWGGECMYATLDGFERLAHLQYIPLIGGEKAVHDIRRLKFAFDMANGSDTPYIDEGTASLFAKIAKNSPLTSSFGRFLDALSYALGICTQRTYDGEPAMKMEPVLSRGRKIDGFETTVRNGEIMTAHLFSEIRDQNICDIAYSAVDSVIEKMVETAADAASRHGTKEIGLTGGVSYSIPISEMFVSHTRKLGYTPVLHDRVPNGDGGVSVGQAAVALRKIQ